MRFSDRYAYPANAGQFTDIRVAATARTSERTNGHGWCKHYDEYAGGDNTLFADPGTTELHLVERGGDSGLGSVLALFAG